MCELPRCRFELPPGKARAYVRAIQLRVLLIEGRTLTEAAEVLGMSRRSVTRLRHLIADLVEVD